MSFLSASTSLPEIYKPLSIEVRQHGALPDGRYLFQEFYCTDRKCDCRKVIVQVFHDGKHVSTINYG